MVNVVYGMLKEDRQYRYNVTMRHVCEGLLPWKSNK